MLDPRKDISEFPELIQQLMRGELPEKVPHWLKVDPSHPAYASVVEFEPEPARPEPVERTPRRYERDGGNDV